MLNSIEHFLIGKHLEINHQSPLIHFRRRRPDRATAGNQSPIPFDTLRSILAALEVRWESITNPL